MVVKCNQTAHQKETVKLIKDFFDLADYNFHEATEWGNSIISRLHGVTGIKFDKPFMAEVFEGSFTTSSLLEKYPINKSQIMYIFMIRENCDDDKTCYEVKATRVYNSGKVYTYYESRGSEKYFEFYIAPKVSTFKGYDISRQQAIKTLVLVADRENVVEREHRKPTSKKEDDLIQNAICDYIVDDDYAFYKTNRVEWVGREDNTDWVTLREGSGKKYEYEDSDYCEHFDKSGYCVESFRQFLFRKLEKYNDYLNLKKVVKADYSLKLQAKYEEIIVLKNLVGTSIINNTDLKTLQTLSYLMDKITDITRSHENIINKLKRSREVYENCKHKFISTHYGTRIYYGKVAKVEEDLKDLDSTIMKIRTKLFDEILQQDIA